MSLYHIIARNSFITLKQIRSMKKLNTSRMLLLAILILAVTACHRKDRPGTEKNKITYDQSAVFPDYEKVTLNTFQISETKLELEAAQKIITQSLAYAGAADKFNLKEPVRENGMLWYKSSSDPSAVLNINLENGDISLNTGMKAYAGNESTRDLLTKDSASTMALTHVRKLGLLGSSPNEYVVSHVGGLNVGVHDEKGNTSVYKKFTTVRLDRKFGDIPVEGHSRIVIQMAEKGRLTGLTKHWASFKGQPVAATAIVATDALKASIEQHILSENTGATSIRVKKITLVYYEQGHGLIEPAIRAECETRYPTSKTDSTERVYPYDIIEPLLKEPRQTYSFMHDRFKGPKTRNDDSKDQKAIPRGQDEQRRDTSRKL